MSEHIDAEQVDEAKDILGDVFKKLVDGFINDTHVILASIDVARSSGNDNEIIDSVHILKSSSFQVGAAKIRSISTEIESYLQTNKDKLATMPVQSNIDSKIGLLRQALADYEAAIKDYL